MQGLDNHNRKWDKKKQGKKSCIGKWMSRRWERMKIEKRQ
jgi:hypothetical protein